jgi:hypothetical protein
MGSNNMMKSARYPYAKLNNYIFVKLIDFNVRHHYKKVKYAYEIYDKQNKLAATLTHRKNKPAIVTYNHNSISEYQYWSHGEKHRSVGPAIIRFDKRREIIKEIWYIDGKKLTDEEAESAQKVVDRRKKMLTLLKNIRKKKSKDH